MPPKKPTAASPGEAGAQLIHGEPLLSPPDNFDLKAMFKFVDDKADVRTFGIPLTESAGKAMLASVPAAGGGRAMISLKPLMDQFLNAPERRKGTAQLHDLASFVAHANRFKGNHSALFANAEGPQLVSVLDYHEAGADGAPKFGNHRGVYAFPLSKEWQAWTDAAGSAMDIGAFAAFLEDRILDVLQPPTNVRDDEKVAEFIDKVGGTLAGPSKLMELSRGLAINVASKVENAVSLSSGEGTLKFTEQHQDGSGQPIKVPSAFLIGVPVFEGGEVYRVIVRLRYRVSGGSVKWIIAMYREDAVFDDAFKGAANKAKEETGLPMFFGLPE